MHPMLNIAVRAARSAGNLIARTIGQSENFEVAQKNKDDLVTSIDKQCDPIDGTTNFVKGIGHCAISMALRHNGKTEVAVVFDPMMDEMFTAARGEGAFLNGRRIRVSSADSLDGSIIGTAFPTRHRDRMNAYLEIFTRLINNCADIRRMGSASLDLCYVACGRLDGYLEQGLKEWDFAAGELILREAGGLATDFLGEPNYVKSGNIVSGNPTMVRNLIKLCDPQSLDAILR